MQERLRQGRRQASPAETKAGKAGYRRYNSIRKWLAKYPNANFAVYTGERCIVVDADVRPSEENGLQSLEYLEIDNGARIPDTVTVLSGRDNGSSHLYFRTPPNFTVKSRGKFLPGVDLKAHNQYVVAPGSRHITGGFYRFLRNAAQTSRPSPIYRHFFSMRSSERAARSPFLARTLPLAYLKSFLGAICLNREYCARMQSF